MAISFNTAASSNTGGVSQTSFTLTIPAGVHSGDVVWLVVHGFQSVSAVNTLQVSSTGTAPVQVGAQQQSPQASGFWADGAVFQFVASATDAGKVITASFTDNRTALWALALAAYAGASNSAPVDVSGGTATGTSPLTFPAETTTIAGDWAIYLAAFGESANASFTGPAGTTNRASTESGGVGAAIWDSNASVGGAGTGIGGAAFQLSSTAATVWLTGFTIGLAPPSTVSSAGLGIFSGVISATAGSKAQGRKHVISPFASSPG